MSDWNQKIIEEFRANEGKVAGWKTLLLLHTTGAKSGLPRLNPTAYTEDKGRLVIIASKGGADTHPDWYYNVVANPNVTIEVGTEKYDAVATVEKNQNEHAFMTRWPLNTRVLKNTVKKHHAIFR